MTPKQLDVFRAVMSTGSTIGASTVLKLSQSAISRQLSGLEAEIGFDLFHRDRGRLVATPEAHLLSQEVGELADVLARLKRRTDELGAGRFGKSLIKMGFPHSMTTTVLPRLIRDFLGEAKEISVELVAGPYDYIERAVMGRTADFGFVRLPTEDLGFEVMPLLSSGMLCAVPADHHLAAQERIGAEDLVRTDLVLLGRLRHNRQEIEERLRNAQGNVQCRVETHSVESSIAMVAEGVGISIVPSLIGSFINSDRVRLIPLEPESWSDYGIITLRDSPLSRPMRRFIDMLRETLLSQARLTRPITVAPGGQ
ncbi:LysR family transcriptional regulator [Devosia sp. XGJD_8]|uniref:LysR family transcriptional regulator n=1 Tax=Devosia sp. XGJD_8 TaxID=3391187 RepID=UPI0039848758